MGHSPNDVDTWWPYQARAIYRAWIEANTVEAVKAPSAATHLEMVSRYMH